MPVTLTWRACFPPRSAGKHIYIHKSDLSVSVCVKAHLKNTMKGNVKEEYIALLMNPSRINPYHLVLKKLRTCFKGGSKGFSVSGKENLVRLSRGRLPAAPLENIDVRERPFPFQRGSSNFSVLTANWLLYRDGKWSRCTNRLFNGCCNCERKHRDLSCKRSKSKTHIRKVDKAAYLQDLKKRANERNGITIVPPY